MGISEPNTTILCERKWRFIWNKWHKNRGMVLKISNKCEKTDFIFVRLQSRLGSLRFEPSPLSSSTKETCLKERHKLVTSLVQLTNGVFFKHIKLNLFRTSSNIKLSLLKTSTNIFFPLTLSDLVFKYIN